MNDATHTQPVCVFVFDESIQSRAALSYPLALNYLKTKMKQLTEWRRIKNNFRKYRTRTVMMMKKKSQTNDAAPHYAIFCVCCFVISSEHTYVCSTPRCSIWFPFDVWIKAKSRTKSLRARKFGLLQKFRAPNGNECGGQLWIISSNYFSNYVISADRLW